MNRIFISLRDLRAKLVAAQLLLALALLPAIAQAGGPFGIDHELGRGDTGIFNRGAQTGLEYGSAALIGMRSHPPSCDQASSPIDLSHSG